MPYLQVTWPGFAKRISKIGTWGSGSPNNAYVTTYKLAFSDNGQQFTDYIERGITRVSCFSGGSRIFRRGGGLGGIATSITPPPPKSATELGKKIRPSNVRTYINTCKSVCLRLVVHNTHNYSQKKRYLK